MPPPEPAAVELPVDPPPIMPPLFELPLEPLELEQPLSPTKATPTQTATAVRDCRCITF
jgi:hypothetical protein